MTSANRKPDEVLERAIEIFGSRGYRATSMRDLADQVGLSKSALYHYFNSKEDLLVAVFKGVIAENIEAAERITASSDRPVDALRRLLVERVVYSCENRRILSIFYEEEAELSDELMSEVVESRRVYQDLVTSLLVRGREAGDLRFSASPAVVANTLLGACNWSYKWFRAEGPRSPEDLAEDMVEIMLGGVLAEQRRPS